MVPIFADTTQFPDTAVTTPTRIEVVTRCDVAPEVFCMPIQRRTNAWLALLALLLLLISPVENALSNNLPDRLSAPIHDHGLPMPTCLHCTSRTVLHRPGHT